MVKIAVVFDSTASGLRGKIDNIHCIYIYKVFIDMYVVISMKFSHIFMRKSGQC